MNILSYTVMYTILYTVLFTILESLLYTVLYTILYTVLFTILESLLYTVLYTILYIKLHKEIKVICLFSQENYPSYLLYNVLNTTIYTVLNTLLCTKRSRARVTIEGQCVLLQISLQIKFLNFLFNSQNHRMNYIFPGILLNP